MSMMTTERRKKIENHIVKTYFTKHFGIEHGSNGWDIIHGSSDRDIPTVLADPTWDEGKVVVHWFVPGEVSYIDPARTKVAAYYELVVVPGWFDTSDNKLELDKANEKIEELDRCLNQANDIIDEWRSNTCCETPTEARKHIEELMQENSDLQVKTMKTLRSPVRVGAIPRNTGRYFKCLNHTLNRILYGDGSTTYGRSLEGIQKYLDKNEYSCVMDAIDQLEVETDALKEDIGEWVKATRCLNPDEAKIKFNKGNDASVALVKERSYILELQKEIAAWQDATSCKVPMEAQSRIVNLLNDLGNSTLRIDSLKTRIARWERSADYWGNKLNEWKKATKCETPEEAATVLGYYAAACDQTELTEEIKEWKKATECDTPEEAKKRIDGLKEHKPARYNKLWITSNGLLISESDITVDVLEAQIEEANKVISEWQRIAECDTPDTLKWKLDYLRSCIRNCEDEIKKLKGDIQAFRDDKAGRNILIESLNRDISKWKTATGCNTPDQAKGMIKLLVDDINVLMRAKED